MKTEILEAARPGVLAEAARRLKAGDLVAFPTDTVYGVAAQVNDRAGIDRLYAVKGREQTKAIAVLLADPTDLVELTAGMNPLAQRLAARFWPGALTLVVPRHPRLPDNLSTTPTIGVRMPDHPVALALMRLTGPLATTSANLSGQASPVDAQAVYAQLSGRISLILDGGRTPEGLPSTVVDCTGTGAVILRMGPISADEILAAGKMDMG